MWGNNEGQDICKDKSAIARSSLWLSQRHGKQEEAGGTVRTIKGFGGEYLLEVGACITWPAARNW